MIEGYGDDLVFALQFRRNARFAAAGSVRPPPSLSFSTYRLFSSTKLAKNKKQQQHDQPPLDEELTGMNLGPHSPLYRIPIMPGKHPQANTQMN